MIALIIAKKKKLVLRKEVLSGHITYGIRENKKQSFKLI